MRESVTASVPTQETCVTASVPTQETSPALLATSSSSTPPVPFPRHKLLLYCTAHVPPLPTVLPTCQRCCQHVNNHRGRVCDRYAVLNSCDGHTRVRWAYAYAMGIRVCDGHTRVRWAYAYSYRAIGICYTRIATEL